jgi:hypothetical protein
MFATPAILIVADTLMTALLSAIDGSAPQKLSIADKNNLLNYLTSNTGDFTQLTKMPQLTGILSQLQSIKNTVDYDIGLINQHSDDDAYKFGIILQYLTNTQTHIQTILNSGMLSGKLNTDQGILVQMISG